MQQHSRLGMLARQLHSVNGELGAGQYQPAEWPFESRAGQRNLLDRVSNIGQ
jgi:hypothetical protein